MLNARTGQEMPLDVGLLEDLEANRQRLDIEAAAAELGDLPWLIVHGEKDASVSVSDAERLAAANPHATLDVIRGAGHTFGAIHPFEGSGPELDRAIRATSEHFKEYLVPEGRRAED